LHLNSTDLCRVKCNKLVSEHDPEVEYGT